MVFFATPNGVAMQQTRALVDAGVKVIDLAADFRIKDIPVWEKWYGMQHACPELVAEAVYALPEINRSEIKGARVIANPGCYPTAVQLGFMPLIEAGVIELKGLGRRLQIRGFRCGAQGRGGTLFSAKRRTISRLMAWRAIAILPEIEQGLSRRAGAPVGLDFRAASDALDPGHSCHALCTSDQGGGFAGAV